MQIPTTLTLLSLALGTNACFVSCKGGAEYDVGSNGGPCYGSQTYIRSAFGYADIVYFDGGKHYQCVDSEGFDLTHIRENVVGCSNGVQGACCGTDRC